MNDDLMVRIAINLAVLSSIVMGLLKFWAQVSSVYNDDFKSKYKFNFIVCVGSWVPYFLKNGSNNFWKLQIFKKCFIKWIIGMETIQKRQPFEAIRYDNK